jgi:hypothetical protein
MLAQPLAARSERGRAAVQRWERRARRSERVRLRVASRLLLPADAVHPRRMAVRSVRPQAEAWSADRCAAVYQREALLPEARHARNARAEAPLRAASLSEKQRVALASQDARAPQAAGLQVAAARASAQQPVAALAPLVLPAEAAAAHVGAAEAEVPHAEAVRGAPHAGVVRAAAHAAGAQQVEAEQAVALRAAAEQPALPERAVGRPSAEAPSSPSPSPFRLRSAPERRPAAMTTRFARGPRWLRVASPSARWWRAARVEVWSWRYRSPEMSSGFQALRFKAFDSSLAINEQALGWIVAGVECGTGFISATKTRENAPVHGAFRG